jgi:putative ABC transport system permease protein
VAGFSVMAQRRLRALGMLSAIGATERNVRLVMVVNGAAVGVAAAIAGTVLGFAAWLAYVPALQQDTGHVVDAANLPWWAIAIGIMLAIATAPPFPASSCSPAGCCAWRSPAAGQATAAPTRCPCWPASSP